MIHRQLYDSEHNRVGMALYHRKNATVDVKFSSEDLQYSNQKGLSHDEFEAFKQRLALSDENTVGQGRFEI